METHNELFKDYEFCKDLDTNIYPEDFINRGVVRSYFALIEGDLFQLKQVTVKGNLENNTLEAHEINLLQEKSFYIADNGVVKSRTAQTGLVPSLLFTATYLMKVFEVEYEIDKGVGFNHFKAAIKIRDRITHPKDKSDLLITSEEFDVFISACVWFTDLFSNLITKIAQLRAVT